MAKSVTRSSTTRTTKAKTATTAVAKETPVAVSETETKNVDIDEVSRLKKPVIKKFDDDYQVLCRSVTSGALYYTGKKSGLSYAWANINDYNYMNFGDLLFAVMSRNSFIYKPCIVIEDADVLEDRRFSEISDLYKKIYCDGDVSQIVNLPINDFIKAINDPELPVGIKQSIAREIATRIQDGRFDSIQKVNAVDDAFKTDLRLLI